MTSVIIPAHNEERGIERLLAGLLHDAAPGEFDVLVISNGSTDDTAHVADRLGARVIEIDEPSKHRALVVGDQVATSFPRLYVDADVRLDTASARALVDALSEPGVLAVAPSRTLDLDGATWAVRAYHRTWEQLPAVRDGLQGRGVLAVNDIGFRRIADRPDVLNDDRFLHSRFTAHERRVVAQSTSVVLAPRTIRALVLKRTRTAQGNSQLAKGSNGQRASSAGSVREVAHMVFDDPKRVPSVAVFVTVTVVARAWAFVRSRGKRSSWLRDDSTRIEGGPVIQR